MTGVSGNIGNDLSTLQHNASDHHGKMDAGDKQYEADFAKEARQQGFTATADAADKAAADGHWSKDDKSDVTNANMEDQMNQMMQSEAPSSGPASPPPSEAQAEKPSAAGVGF